MIRCEVFDLTLMICRDLQSPVQQPPGWVQALPRRAPAPAFQVRQCNGVAVGTVRWHSQPDRHCCGEHFFRLAPLAYACLARRPESGPALLLSYVVREVELESFVQTTLDWFMNRKPCPTLTLSRSPSLFVCPACVQGDAPRANSMMSAVRTLSLATFLCNETATECEAWAQRAAFILRTWYLSDHTAMEPNLYYGQIVPTASPPNKGHGGFIEVGSRLPTSPPHLILHSILTLLVSVHCLVVVSSSVHASVACRFLFAAPRLHLLPPRVGVHDVIFYLRRLYNSSRGCPHSRMNTAF